MKKTILCLLLLAVLLCACAPAGEVAENNDGKPLIVCTVFPEYDWLRQLLGERADRFDLRLLLHNGADMHSYQPSVEDMVAISSCDMLVYVGGQSDRWLSDMLAGDEKPERIAVDLFDVLSGRLLEEELSPGMEEEEEEDGGVYDEHVWLSLKNAEIVCDRLTEQLSLLDPQGAEVYAVNNQAYQSQLQALDADYRQTLDAAPVKRLLFGDRFPFLYLVKDYQLAYDAAFPGCSAETEASFETVTYLAGQLKTLGLPAVLTLENSASAIAETIVKNSGAENVAILTLNSMQSVTDQEIDAGAAYLSIMEENLQTLRQALN
ncbi:MAG: metal ABC transporter substrate-binding protein [Firmicutes bacterium]|nr:metal ABC transporter substrate-binding protein [Bacillota bacterium]